jgi:ribosomal protein S18 acetylase RimI-like enzyme
MNFSIRPAQLDDLDAIRELMPRLAEFELPRGRVAEHLWKGDEKILLAWAAGKEPGCLIQVAVSEDQHILGVAMSRLRDELLSGEPSAHLEALMVAKSAEGSGIGRALMDAAESAAAERGAKSMTLHAFASNTRACRLYDGLGYDGELIRYTKNLPD